MKLVDFKSFDLKACSSEACLHLDKQGEAVWAVFRGKDGDTAGLQFGMETCNGYQRAIERMPLHDLSNLIKLSTAV